MDVRLPDGTIIKGVPDNMSKADLTAKLKANGYDVSKLEAPTVAASEIPAPRKERGFFGTIGAPIQAASEGIISGGGNVMFGAQRLLGMGLEKVGGADASSLGRAGQFLQEDAARRLAESQGRVAPFKQEFPVSTGAGELGAEVVGTLPVGAVIAAPLRAIPAAAPLAQAIRTGGFSKGNIATRAAGGATLGGASAAVINPEDAALGATIGGAVPFAGPALGYVGGKVANMRTMPQNRAASLAQQAAGADLKEVVNALRNAPPGVGVAQTLARFENPALQALVRDSLESTPEGAQYLSKLGTMTEKQAVNELAKIAGGVSAAETRATAELAKNNLNVITTPMREASLGRVNLGKFVADEAASREANDLAVLMGSGSEIDPARFVLQATGAEKALRSVGIKPLEGAPLANQIAAISKNPSFAGNDLVEGSVQRVAEDIARWTSSNGVIDANALEAIRKNAVNAAIAKLRPGADATAQRNLAAGVMSNIKPLIDKAIEDAGGAGWREYLTTHAKGMQKIAEKKLTGEALALFKNNKNEFVRLVQNESPETVEKFLGPGNYNIALELADSTMDVLRKQATGHLDRVAASKQATEGQKALATLVSQNTSMLRFPNLINAWAAAGNKTISELEKRIGVKTTKTLSDAMQDPQTAANLLESIPASERNKIIQLLNNPSVLGLKGAAVTRAAAIPAAPINALAPQSENQNALAR
jgi:hypothetical protein